jgi:hypothetical protein
LAGYSPLFTPRPGRQGNADNGLASIGIDYNDWSNNTHLNSNDGAVFSLAGL